jgi:hypothetical protein
MFRITIEETLPVTKTIGKRWEKVGQKEEVNREGTDTYLADVMGYTPEVETVVDETFTRLVQEVDELDLKAVITAINGLAQG